MGATVLIVDDHVGFRSQARRLLTSEGYTVIGVSGSVAGGFEAACALEPELALIDLQLPDGDGFELASRLRGLEDSPAVVLTSSRDRATVLGAADRGAWRFVPKAELSRATLEVQLRERD